MAAPETLADSSVGRGTTRHPYDDGATTTDHEGMAVTAGRRAGTIEPISGDNVGATPTTRVLTLTGRLP
jgi:hypothetical protein